MDFWSDVFGKRRDGIYKARKTRRIRWLGLENAKRKWFRPKKEEVMPLLFSKEFIKIQLELSLN